MSTTHTFSLSIVDLGVGDVSSMTLLKRNWGMSGESVEGGAVNGQTGVRRKRRISGVLHLIT